MALLAACTPFWPLHNLYWLENRCTSYSFQFHHFSYSDILDLMLISAQVHEDWILAFPVNHSWHRVGKKCDLDSCLSSYTEVMVFLPSCARPAGISLFSSDFRVQTDTEQTTSQHNVIWSLKDTLHITWRKSVLLIKHLGNPFLTAGQTRSQSYWGDLGVVLHCIW